MTDTAKARRYGHRELRPDDSYHAAALLEALDEIDRLRTMLSDMAATTTPSTTRTVDWSTPKQLGAPTEG